ncbi:MAG TPA: hypothetical protein VGG29_19265 [Caulobacteraceae bacterium]|jgi:hypothetical protein
MRPKPRQALRRGRCAVLWENAVIGTAETRYFVQCLGMRRTDSTDFRALPDAERYFELIEEAGPRAGLGLGSWRDGFGLL